MMTMQPLAPIFQFEPSLHRAPSPADKYRGAVVEDLQLSPAFCLPADESISRAIDLAFDRDFSHIPLVLCSAFSVRFLKATRRVLTKEKKPLGYIDVTALKEKFQAGKANPVRLTSRPALISIRLFT